MFAIALIAILFAQGNALLNGEGSPLNDSTMPLEQQRVIAYQSVLTCTQKVVDSMRANCDSEIQHYNNISAQYLDAERQANQKPATSTMTISDEVPST